MGMWHCSDGIHEQDKRNAGEKEDNYGEIPMPDETSR
jgi:hypothetical protein